MKEEVPEQTEDSILEEPVVEEPKKVKKDIVKVKEKAQSGMIELVLDIYMQYNAIEAIVMTLCLIIFVRFHFSSFFQNHIENGTNLLRLLFWDEIQIYNM